VSVPRTRTTSSQPSAAVPPPGFPPGEPDVAELAAEVAELRAQLAEVRAEVRLLRAGRAAEAAPPGPARVMVRDTGGGLPVVDLEPLPPVSPTPAAPASLSRYDRGPRKAVAVYAEGAEGPMRVYDQLGSCVFAR
jgi:hypothetical protein